MNDSEKVSISKPRISRNSWWQDSTGKRMFIITRLEYGNGAFPIPSAYEVFEKDNVDSPMIIEAKVWEAMVAKSGLVRMR